MPLKRVGFICAGQGSSISEIRSLITNLSIRFPNFQRIVDECFRELETIIPDAALIRLTEDSTLSLQILLFIFQIALAHCWKEWLSGDEYEIVACVGHSFGEIVAAYLAGHLTVHDALELIWERGCAMAQMESNDGTYSAAAIFTDLMTVKMMLLETMVTDAFISSMNGPNQIVVTGLSSSVDRLMAFCGARDIRCVQLSIRLPFHTPMIRPALVEFGRWLEAKAEHATVCQPIRTLWSTMTAKPVEGLISFDHWFAHALNIVQFERTVKDLVEQESIDYVIDLGPEPTMTNLVGHVLSTTTETEAKTNAQVIPSFARKSKSLDTLFEGIRKLTTADEQ
jgi:acyl transferase domain-containing protein